MSGTEVAQKRPNGEVVIGDVECDGRTILYVIRGERFSKRNSCDGVVY